MTIVINKGNYSLESSAREAAFEQRRAAGWEERYRWYRSEWQERPARRDPGPYPLLVDLELSTACNLKCPMCYTTTEAFRQKVPARLMDFQLVSKVLGEIGPHVPALRLSLRGEPTLHPGFVKTILLSKECGIGEVSFLTNASNLTPAMNQAIVDAGADWITISIDGLDERYEAIRKPLLFNETLAKLKNLFQTREESGKMRPAIKVQGVWPALRDDPQAYYNTISPWCDLIAFNPLIDYLGKDDQIQYDLDFVCTQHYQRLVIAADGKALLCANDEDGSVVVGDANTETIAQIWNGPLLQKQRELQLQPGGFLANELCRRCYLPRKTEESECAEVNGQSVAVHNYVDRAQEIGK